MNGYIKRMIRIMICVSLIWLLIIPVYAGENHSFHYTRVYEPDTSWPMSATVAWYANDKVKEVAEAYKRPSTAFVWLDEDLNVYDREGLLLSDSLDSYVGAIVKGMIPAFYIRNEKTAENLKAYLQKSGLEDCFVVSTPENKKLVQNVADLLHVRGMIDYSQEQNPDRNIILEMVASVNGAHGKVVLISEEAATKENILLLQSLGISVWVETSEDLKTLFTLYTNGVNGILVTDYEPAIRVLEWFQDDGPTLLRLPLIVGHRGDPSTYVENTLYSALGAYAEGVDAIENDIRISSDGEVFIFHDDTPKRLLGIKNVEYVEDLSLSELKSHHFLWDDPDYGVLTKNEVPVKYSRFGTLIGTETMNVIPTLKEYLETFKGTGVIHFTEIKSKNPGIIQTYKEILDEYDSWDQVFTITFYTDILNILYNCYPEISVGALGYQAEENQTEITPYDDYETIAKEKGTETALRELCSILDQWNASYCPYYIFSREVVTAGRHRGLTVWPWTYMDPKNIAEAYLSGWNGMTTDYPWCVSECITGIIAKDITVYSEEEIPKPESTTRIGGTKVLQEAELVLIEDLDQDRNQSLMIWRYQADMKIAGNSYGSYYLYSNPFTVTWEK